jgi:serine/threonine-protein kinase
LLKPGSIIDSKYQIEHLIAEGGMAEVYLATCLKPQPHGSYVAIKRLQSHLRNHANIAELFEREAAHIINFKSPHIVQGIELIKSGSEILLIMKHIFGFDLSKAIAMLRTQALSIRIQVAIAVGRAIGHALKYIREWPDEKGDKLNLVHGDISAQNIILSTTGGIYLVDFGVASRPKDSLAQSRELLRGTWRYMAPELCEGHANSEASDIYALGVVLEEIIGEKLETHKVLQAFIYKAKSKESLERYQQADDFLVDLEIIANFYKVTDTSAAITNLLALSFPQIAKPKNSGSSVAVFFLVMIALLIMTSVIAAGTHFFYPRLPPVGAYDHHCESYGEAIFKE